MTRTTLGALAALFTLGNAMAAERDTPITVNVTGLTPNVAAKVTEHARQGERALARYLETLRPYRQVTLHDVTQEPAQPPQAKFDPQREYRKHAREWHQSIHGKAS